MKKYLLIVLILSFGVNVEAQTKKTTSSKTTTSSKSKENPKVTALVKEAYELYNESADDECQAVIKKILALDKKNKDAYILKANLAMFAFDFEDMWSNLNQVFKYYPEEADVYSNFAMTHLNYMYLSDSAKRSMCLKTIRNASRSAEGYAALGMVAAVGGYYEEAISCFDVAYVKVWKDTFSRVILDLPYANCLYSTGDTVGAITKLNRIIPRMSGKDKYTCVYLRAKYKLEINQNDVLQDLDTLNVYAGKQAEVLLLNAKYYAQTNRKDTACKIAKDIRKMEGTEGFDMTPYCQDLDRCLEMSVIRKLTYDMDGLEFVVNVTEFVYPASVRFNWSRGSRFDTKGQEKGIVHLTSRALDSSYILVNDFNAEADVVMDKSIAFWLSRVQFNEITMFGNVKINELGVNMNRMRLVGHQQIEVKDANNKLFYMDCMVLSDGTNLIYYLNDPSNPLIVKIETEIKNIVLTKVQ